MQYSQSHMQTRTCRPRTSGPKQQLSNQKENEHICTHARRSEAWSVGFGNNLAQAKQRIQVVHCVWRGCGEVRHTPRANPGLPQHRHSLTRAACNHTKAHAQDTPLPAHTLHAPTLNPVCKAARGLTQLIVHRQHMIAQEAMPKGGLPAALPLGPARSLASKQAQHHSGQLVCALLP